MMMLRQGGPIEPASDGYNWMYFYVEDNSAPVRLMGYCGDNEGFVIIDGETVAIPSGNKAFSYTFASPGLHLMKYKELEGKGYSRFHSCPTLKEGYFARFPEGGTTFGNCTALENIELPDDLTSMNAAVFTDSPLLVINTKNVTSFTGSFSTCKSVIFSGITELPWNICRINVGNQSLQYVEVGPLCETVASTPFYSCVALTTIVFRPTTPPSGENPFYGLNTDFKCYVPYSSDHSVLAAYKAARYWSNYESRIYELNPDGTIPTT
jgi:hypothetical protein